MNEDVVDDIGIINSDPYDTGWMIVVEIKDLGELDNLLDATEYRDYVGEGIGLTDRGTVAISSIAKEERL